MNVCIQIWERPFKKSTIFGWTFGSMIVGTGAIMFSVSLAQYKGGFWFKGSK